MQDTVFVIGVEPTPSYYETMRQRAGEAAWGQRRLMLQRACVGPDDQSEEVTLQVHLLQECNSLMSTRAGVKVHRGACIGLKATTSTSPAGL